MPHTSLYIVRTKIGLHIINDFGVLVIKGRRSRMVKGQETASVAHQTRKKQEEAA